MQVFEFELISGKYFQYFKLVHLTIVGQTILIMRSYVIKSYTHVFAVVPKSTPEDGVLFHLKIIE